MLIGYAEQNPDTEMTVEFDTGEQYGFGVAEGENQDLLEWDPNKPPPGVIR